MNDFRSLTFFTSNSWRRVKRDFLHHFHKPRLDLLVWILVTKLAPTYYRKLETLLIDTGRYRELSSWRKAFKKEWLKSAKTPITTPLNPKYKPNPVAWVCTCPNFSTSRFLICKHLVQSVHPVLPIFFLEVTRNRTTPFWHHKQLVPLDRDQGRVCEAENDISNADEDNLEGRTLSGEAEESDDENNREIVDTDNGSTRLTLAEQFRNHIDLLRDFCDGLEYQVQFSDPRMLEVMERDGSSMFRLARNCLSRERRLNSTRGSSPTTWERGTTNAMYYRARPRASDG